MSKMTSRERVMLALQHQEPDRVPWDCTFTIGAYMNLKRYLGLTIKEDPRPSSNWLAVQPPVEMLKELCSDLYYIGLGRARDIPSFEYGMDRYTDEWGVTYRKVLQPSGSFDYQFEKHPLRDAKIRDLEHYDWPDPDNPGRIKGLAEKCEYLYKNTDFALVGKFGTPIFEQAFYLRGLYQWLIDLVSDPEFAGALMDKLTDIAIGMVGVGLRACGRYIQILRLAGDDIGHQRGTFISPELFRKLVKPRFARLYSAAKTDFLNYNPNGNLMVHVDGDVYPIIEDYIEMGLDILNPVQPSVADMEHKRLKSEFGSRLSFHGGIDIQGVLVSGTPAEVKTEARKTIATLAVKGGYILAPAHYLQHDMPPENIIALRDAVLEYGVYP